MVGSDICKVSECNSPSLIDIDVKYIVRNNIIHLHIEDINYNRSVS